MKSSTHRSEDGDYEGTRTAPLLTLVIAAVAVWGASLGDPKPAAAAPDAIKTNVHAAQLLELHNAAKRQIRSFNDDALKQSTKPSVWQQLQHLRMQLDYDFDQQYPTIPDGLRLKINLQLPGDSGWKGSSTVDVRNANSDCQA